MRLFAVGLDLKTADLLRRRRPRSPRLALEEVSAEQALTRLERGSLEVDALVIGDALEAPIRLAQRVHVLDRDLAVVLVAEPMRQAVLRRAVRFAPFLGDEVSCRSTAEGELLVRAMAEAAFATRQRRSYRAALAAANARVTLPAPGLTPANLYLERVLEHAPIGVAALDARGLVVSWNRHAGLLLGVRERDALGTPLEALVPEPGRTALTGLFAVASAGALAPPAAVLERPGPDGRPQFLEATAAPLVTGTGEAGLLVLLRDVTERVLAEREREVARRNAAFLAEVGGVLASSLDPETALADLARLTVPAMADWCLVDLAQADGSFRRLAVGHADPGQADLARELERTYRTTPAAAQGAAGVGRTGRPELRAEVGDDALADLARDSDELRLLRAIGMRSCMAVPLVARGRTLGTISFIAAGAGRSYGEADLALAEEVARRAALAVDNARLYREAQDAAREAREAVRVRDDFLSVASHELRTPLTPLQLQVQILRDALRQGSLESLPHGRLAALLESAERQILRFGRLVDELLDTSRITAGRLALDLEDDVDLADVVRGVVARFEGQLAAARCEATVTVRAEARGRWDRIRLEQVVTNLISNAVKYGAGRPIDIEVAADDRTARLAVRDQGVGIALEDQGRIFERFERVGSGRRPSGLGLGLYIVRELVQAHGGSVRVVSAPAVGSTFSVELPLAGPTEDGSQEC